MTQSLEWEQLSPEVVEAIMTEHIRAVTQKLDAINAWGFRSTASALTPRRADVVPNNHGIRTPRSP